MTANVYTPSAPCVKNAVAGYSFTIALLSQSDTKLHQDNPTMAAGDFTKILDGTNGGNLTNLPAAVSGNTRAVRITLTQAEINADEVVVLCHDAAGAQWCDLMIVIRPDVASTVGTSDFAGGAVASVTAGVTLADDAITAAKIAADAIGADEISAAAVTKLQAGLSTLTAAQVWAYATRTLTSFGTLVADIWTYASRTLTMTGEAILAVLTGNAINIQRGDDVTISLTVGALTNHEEVWFTGKTNKMLPDSKSVFQVTETGGLVVFQGEEVTGAGCDDAELTVVDETTGAITITFYNSRTRLLKYLRSGYADVQMRDDGGIVTTKKNYRFTIDEDVTRSV